MSEKKKDGFFSRLLKTDIPDELRKPKPADAQAGEQAGEQPDNAAAPLAEAVIEAPAKPAEPAAPEPVPVIPPVPEEPAAAEEEFRPVPATPDEPDEQARTGWFKRLRAGLSKSSTAITSGITGIFTQAKLDDATLEDLEDVLIQADLGIETATAITQALAKDRYDKAISDEEVRTVLATEVEKVLLPVATPLAIDTAHRPFVILMVGVNGSGKTTTIGKLSAKFRAAGHSVMLAAGDTFRAAAIEQLKIWGERTGSPVVARDQGADAAGLAFDAMKEAQAAGTDILMIDTAGRLQNRVELMAELEKVVRVIRKNDESAPHAVLLTLDATTGQNALNQVEVFREKAGVTGLVMTKLDGTARGGILVAIAAKYGLPVHYIGVGEGVDDLHSFQAGDFAGAIAGLSA
jgi:fused signal recognition particle receptor